MDGDTYFVQKRSAQAGFGPPEGAKADVYEAANKFCEARGMALETVEFTMVNSRFGRPGSGCAAIPMCSSNSAAEQCTQSILEPPEAWSTQLTTRRETAEKHGVKYDPLQDQVLNGLARFREIAHDRLNCETSVIHPKEVEKFLGSLKPKPSGLFSS
jgi:hypothetical protein